MAQYYPCLGTIPNMYYATLVASQERKCPTYSLKLRLRYAPGLGLDMAVKHLTPHPVQSNPSNHPTNSVGAITLIRDVLPCFDLPLD